MDPIPENRISTKFKQLKNENRAGLITFLTAGDPDVETCSKILQSLPKAGADLIEIGIPFSDPMADGPAIQASSLRALKNGMTLSKTIDLVRGFRNLDATTPIILMGYYNPIYAYGVDNFLRDAKRAGIDGLIVVDLPPEEPELCIPCLKNGLNFIYLTAPTTKADRLPKILKNATGFIYHVSITGITGTATAATKNVKADVELIKTQTKLPVAVGFGIRSPQQAKKIAEIADAAVVGSALIDVIKENLLENGRATESLPEKVLQLVTDLSLGIRTRGK